VALRLGVRQGLRPGVRQGVPLVDRVLAVGIVLNIALYLDTMASTEGAHEIAIVLPYAAALAGRMLALRCWAAAPRSGRPAPWCSASTWPASVTS
jgi:hypothetical protein